MAGAWEIIQSQQVLVVILTREIVSTAWAFSFRNLIIPGLYTGLSGMTFDHARNVGAQKTLENGFQWCFFLDDDCICPPDIIPRLMAHRQPIVSGIYYRRAKPLVPVMLKDVPGGRQWITEYPKTGLIEVDYVGAGCLLIHRDVFGAVAYPWFEWKIDKYHLPEAERMSEDFSFCRKCRQAGLKVLVDCSLVCKHAGLSQSVYPGIMEPLELI